MLRMSGRTTACLLLALVVPPVALLLPLPRAGRLFGILLDLGHLAMGAVVCWVFWMVLRAVTSISRWGCAAWAWLATVAFLGAAEVAQSVVDRSPSLSDVLANGLGATVALVVLGRAWRRWWRPALLAAIPFAIGLAPAALHAWDTWQQQRTFPVLADFETQLELSRWRMRNSNFARTTEHASRGTHALAVTLGASAWPNVQLAYPVPDWRGYATFAFDIHVDEPATILVNVVDRHHNAHYTDRFTQALPLVPGWNHFRIPMQDIASAPADRTMDLSHIYSVQWFADHPTQPISFRLDAVRLEK